MNRVLLVSHGLFAEGLKDSLEMFVGAKDNIDCCILAKTEDLSIFEKKLQAKLDTYDSADQILVLADLIGGSPLTTTMKLLANKYASTSFKVLGGMNFAMALSAVLNIENGLNEACEAALREGQNALNELVLETEDEEDI